MSDKSGIEWVAGDDGTPGATWNPVTGCDKVSGQPGFAPGILPPGRPAADPCAAFAANLRRLRKEQHLTQAQLAEKAGVGRTTVGCAEQRLEGTSLAVAGKLAAALGTTVGAMLEVAE